MSFSHAFANQVEWHNIRDGAFIIEPHTNDILNIEWSPAWLTDANSDELYLINSNGELVENIYIPKNNSKGKHSIAINNKDGAYRLIVPGYSFRSFNISHSSQTTSLFEPNKLHFSLDIQPQSVFYFKSLKNSKVIFSGKYYSGANKIFLQRLSDNLTLHLYLSNHSDYSIYDSLKLPLSENDQLWKVSFNNTGKISFWLDGSENLFSLNKENLDPKKPLKAYTRISLTGETVGLAPDIGVALPYVNPPDNSHNLIKSFNLKSANFYSLVDVITKKPERELQFRALYLDKFNIKNNITLLAGNHRKAVLKANAETLNGLTKWVEDTLLLDSSAKHYIAFADEPNLNYSSYNEFSSYFESMLTHLKSIPNVYDSGIQVAIPASSRFLDGPFRPSAHTRLGIDWSQRLLTKHSTDIQAIAWHEWMIRNLYSTRRYQDSIKAAAQLVGLNNNGRPNKALLIDQTNISSGSTLSPYEQDTHYAALWWASVIINASQTGLLDMLNWFQIADDPNHMKGLLSISDSDQFSLKPVGKAHIFLNEKWLKNVKKLDNSSFEVDVLYTQEKNDHQLIGVNKSTREHWLSVDLNTTCPPNINVKVFDKNSNIYNVSSSCSSGTLNFKIPEQSIFKVLSENMK